jgi:hypothetical protein
MPSKEVGGGQGGGGVGGKPNHNIESNGAAGEAS